MNLVLYVLRVQLTPLKPGRWVFNQSTDKFSCLSADDLHLLDLTEVWLFPKALICSAVLSREATYFSHPSYQLYISPLQLLLDHSSLLRLEKYFKLFLWNFCVARKRVLDVHHRKDSRMHWISQASRLIKKRQYTFKKVRAARPGEKQLSWRTRRLGNLFH